MGLVRRRCASRLVITAEATPPVRTVAPTAPASACFQYRTSHFMGSTARTVDERDASQVAPTVERCRQPGVEDLEQERLGNQPFSDRQDVRVVVRACQARRLDAPAQTAAHALHT